MKSYICSWFYKLRQIKRKKCYFGMSMGVNYCVYQYLQLKVSNSVKKRSVSYFLWCNLNTIDMIDGLFHQTFFITCSHRFAPCSGSACISNRVSFLFTLSKVMQVFRFLDLHLCVIL